MARPDIHDVLDDLADAERELAEIAEAAGWDLDESPSHHVLVGLIYDHRAGSDLFEMVEIALEGGAEPNDEGTPEHRVWCLVRELAETRAEVERLRRMAREVDIVECPVCEPVVCGDCSEHGDPASCPLCDGSSLLHEPDCAWATALTQPDDDREEATPAAPEDETAAKLRALWAALDWTERQRLVQEITDDAPNLRAGMDFMPTGDRR
jgi:hypothetical protein